MHTAKRRGMPIHGTALLWFRRDLRLRDNAALADVVRRARIIIPVFVFAPDEEEEWAPGAASRWWLHHSLSALDVELRKRGSRLILRSGATLHALRTLAHETKATLLVWNRLYEPHIAARDRQLIDSVGAELEITTHQAHVLFEPGSIRNGEGKPYKVFTAFWRSACTRLDQLPPPLTAPRTIPSPRAWPASKRLDDFALLPRVRWDSGLASSWKPGERGALEQLSCFVTRVPHYEEGRNRPDWEGTSRLSPHLHFGEIGPQQLRHELHKLAVTGTGVQSYVRQLGWREFAHHLLHDFPTSATRPLDRKFEAMPWSRRRSALRSWQRGMTGYPIIDAGMRELWHTGWMHNRVRMIVASFLTKNLQQQWLQGARWFWDTLVDADLANNTLGWQWTAGCGADAAPYYRIFNPVLQAERFDPQRSYLRHWVPELSALPDRWIHRPWAAPAAVLSVAKVQLGKTYPRPMIDLQDSRAAAMQAYRRIQMRTD
jgi:deoxyribodipyrimidine photo-lyase